MSILSVSASGKKEVAIPHDPKLAVTHTPKCNFWARHYQQVAKIHLRGTLLDNPSTFLFLEVRSHRLDAESENKDTISMKSVGIYLWILYRSRKNSFLKIFKQNCQTPIYIWLLKLYSITVVYYLPFSENMISRLVFVVNWQSFFTYNFTISPSFFSFHLFIF